MAWRSPGTTRIRELLDQNSTVNWSGLQAKVGFTKLQTVGFLRGLTLEIPHAQGTATITSGNNLNPLVGAQLPSARAFQKVSVRAQGINPFYDSLKGTDLIYLAAMGNGGMISDDWYGDGTIGVPADTNASAAISAAFATQLDQGGYAGQGLTANSPINTERIAATSTATTTASFLIGEKLYIPFTEHIRFAGAMIKDSQGNVAQMNPDKMEIGFLPMQNLQQNVSPDVWLNPLWAISSNASTSAGAASWASSTTEAPYVGSDTSHVPSSGTIATTVNLWAHFFDVPDNPADWPTQQQMQWIVTRTSTEIQIPTNGKVRYDFAAAGLLLKVAFVVYDANYNILDVSGCTGNATVKYGATEIISDTSTRRLVQKANKRYSANTGPPPPALYLDFLADGAGTLSDVIDTADLTEPRVEFSGLTAASTSVTGALLAGVAGTNGLLMSDISTATPRGTAATPAILRGIEVRMLPVRGR